jgi:hydroxymethylpyrimidine pyrophosphatase-like HAD family hydrolase
MGNAVERVKAAADVVAPRHADDGLARFIAEHLLPA